MEFVAHARFARDCHWARGLSGRTSCGADCRRDRERQIQAAAGAREELVHLLVDRVHQSVLGWRPLLLRFRLDFLEPLALDAVIEPRHLIGERLVEILGHHAEELDHVLRDLACKLEICFAQDADVLADDLEKRVIVVDTSNEIAGDGDVRKAIQREMQVLALIAEGKSNQEISAELYLALNTVKRHAYNIFAKLEVKKRTQAVAKARQLGLIP